MKTDIEIRLRLTWSKILGGVLLLGGLYSFMFKKELSSEAIIVIGIGAGMIGYKQHLISKQTIQ